MSILDAFRIALTNLRRYPLRTGLSVIGIVIGILAVSLTVALGDAVKNSIINQISAFGTNVIRVNTKIPGLSTMGTASAQVRGVLVTTLKMDDIERLRQFPFVQAVAGYTTAQGWGVAGNRKKQLLILATTPEYPATDAQTKLQNGRFFTEAEERGAVPVIVLGDGARAKLFGAGTGIGETVRIGLMHYRVIGTLAPRGSVAFFNFDDIALIPLKTGQQHLLGIDYIQEAAIKLTPGITEKEAALYVTDFLRRAHSIPDPKKDDFIVTTTEQAIAIVGTVTNVMKFLLIILASISLIVGGVGVMNIMLVSVSERLHEIGLRRAYGATRRDIFQQFVVESIVLTVAGGILGVALSAMLVLIAAILLKVNNVDWPVTFPFSAALIAVLVSAGVGFVFGLSPARRAAQLELIQSLRAE